MKISELTGEVPAWLLEADVSNEEVTIDADGVVTWHSGTWHSGTWHSGTWMGGTWHSGTWIRGAWHGGTWHSGTWYNGTWYGGLRLAKESQPT